MSIVAVAILISFHLKAEASPLEKRIALPFGLVFWCLAIACLAAGLNNYIKTVSRYSRRQALVQSGTGTQLVSFFWAVGGLMRLGGFLFVCVVVCANEDVTS